MGKVKVGDRVPFFSLPNQDGRMVDLSDYIGKPIVVFFYPKDETPGCIKETCAFRDSHDQFIEAGVTVFGISADTIDSHKSFKLKYKLPYDLLSDENNKVRKTFGVSADLFGLIPGRVTYIIDNHGIVRRIFNNQLNFKKHVDESLKMIELFTQLNT